MSMGELISIILPVYNVDSILFVKSINSVLNQTYDNFELNIIVDFYNEQVNDELISILDEYGDDKRINSTLYNNRRGLVRCLNEGIIKSKGKYVARLDADDVCFKDRLEKQITKMKTENYQLCGTWSYLCDLNENIILPQETPITQNEIRKSIMLHNPFIHSTVMVEKAIFSKVGLYDPRFPYTEDYDLWMRVISMGYSAYNLPEYLLQQYITEQSVTRKNWRRNRLYYIKCKYHAYNKYGYNKFIDILGLLISPLGFLVSPDLEIITKKILSRFNMKTDI